MTRALGGRELLLRTSSGLDLIQRRSPSGIQTHDVGRHLLELPIIEGDPIRVGGQWQNRPNQHGLYFWQRTGQHIWYESALEAANLVALDQAGEVDKIAAQPFRLLFRTDAKSVRHDPDFFAIHRNGDQVVYDVKPLTDMARTASRQLEVHRRARPDRPRRHRQPRRPVRGRRARTGGRLLTSPLIAGLRANFPVNDLTVRPLVERSATRRFRCHPRQLGRQPTGESDQVTPALIQYQTCINALTMELDADAEPAAVALRNQIRAHEPRLTGDRS